MSKIQADKLAKVPVVSRGTAPKEKKFPVDYYSYSSIALYSTNPFMFKIKYINRDRFETTQNISSVVGRAFHAAMYVYWGGREESLPENQGQAMELALKTGMTFLEKYNDGWIEYSEKIPNKQKALNYLSFMITSYFKQKPWNTKDTLLGTELEISMPIDITYKDFRLKMPIPLKGYMDKVVLRDGKIKIIDYKTCTSFSKPDKIDGNKIIQAIQYYLLCYAYFGKEPYSMIYEEVKMTKNKDKSPQVREYELIYKDHVLFFDFYFRMYEDVTRALSGEAVFVPNIDTFYDNEVGIIAYILRMDMTEEQAALMKKHKVDTLTDLLKKKIQRAGTMRTLLKNIEKQFISTKSMDYKNMPFEERINLKLLEHGMMLAFDSKVEGATVDLYRYEPTPGVKMSRLEGYVSDIEQVLGKQGVRVLAPIPGSMLVGFEVPKDNRYFPALPAPTGTYDLAIGQTILGNTRYFDFREAPHILVAGATGSGKSVFLNALIEQLTHIQNVELHLFDPKRVELSPYKHLAKQYLHDHAEINNALEDLVIEMEERYQKLQNAGARNIGEISNMMYKVIVIDEFGDLSSNNSNVQGNVLLLAQKARAAGIHLIIATQRPSVDVINGTIKANFPIKAVFRVAKEVDSRVVLDEAGAEKLLNKGDMLFSSTDGTERLQGFNV